jgi:O-glycosyl hydrolase
LGEKHIGADEEIEMFGNYFYAYVFFILILSLGTSYGDTNVLTNPGFESGTTGWAARSCSISTVTSPVHSGSYSGWAYNRTATWQGIKQSMLGKMVSGKTYRISGWARISSTSATVKVTFEKQDGSGTSYYSVASATATNSGWVELSGNYTLNVTGTLAVLDVYFEGPPSEVSIYVDDANVYGPEIGSPDSNATGNVNTNVRHQVLDGFGAAGAWYEGSVLAYSEPTRTALFNTMFGELGLDIYRVRNTYNIDNGYITRSAQIIAAGEASLGHPIRVMNSSWSPPASLKSNGSTVGGTLAKDVNGDYRYADFAQWWRDSLNAWSNAGVNTYYVNMQNEPDWTASWDTCRFDPTEDSSYAGYNLAFRSLYNNLNTMPNRPKLLVPEGANISGTPSYVNALTATDKSNVYGYSHHLYDGSADDPDGFLTPMVNLKAQIGDRPLLQTEFSKGGPFTFTDEMNLAKLIHNALTVEEVTAYLYWELFWASPSGLVSLTTPTPTINPVYYAMKHYSAFTDPNWQRVDASTDSPSLRISAYIHPGNNQLSVVIINTSTDTNIELDLSFTGFTVTGGDIYRSSQSENCVLVGSFNPANPLTLPANSITTLSLSSGTGAVLCEWWTDITGTEVNALTSDVNYPANSTGRELLTKLEGPTNWGDNYGARIQGYLKPVTSGNYRFWIASNDSSELWLSTNDDPCNATRIAYVQGYTNARQWDKYTTQKSSLISLVAGQKYYIEVLHKEGTGDDNIAVAWQGPGISQQVINSIYLSPCCLKFADFAGFAAQWNRNDCNTGNDWCYGFDLDRDGTVLLDDLEVFIDGWLIGIE